MDQTRLDPYQVLLSYPSTHAASHISLLDSYGKPLFTSQHQEPVLVASHNHSNVVPPYNAYSAQGTPQVSGDTVPFLFIYMCYSKDMASCPDKVWLI